LALITWSAFILSAGKLLRPFSLFILLFSVGGNLFSSVVSSSPSVGASTSICGLLTGALSMIFINWQAFNGNQELEKARCILIFVLILMVVLNLLFVGQGNELYAVDTYGHLGGAMAGLFWGLAFFPRVKNP
jgi:membrane associated rhomboid family serine protease